MQTVAVKKKYTKPTAFVGFIGVDKIVIIEVEECNEYLVKSVAFDYAESIGEIENEYIICNERELHELENYIPKEN